VIGDWGLVIGDWGLVNGDWVLWGLWNSLMGRLPTRKGNNPTTTK
jgi:hypothetical protein